MKATTVMEDNVKGLEKKIETYNRKQDLHNRKVEDTLALMMQSIDEIRSQLQGASTSHRNRIETVNATDHQTHTFET